MLYNDTHGARTDVMSVQSLNYDQTVRFVVLMFITL